jgi:hypothetical protein
MGRPPRTIVGNMVYHILNRANGRFKIFHKNKDYEALDLAPNNFSARNSS